MNIDLQKLLSWVIPDPEDCKREAMELRLADPDLAPLQLAEKALQSARKWGAGIGAATGMAASPITMIPAALAEAAALLRMEGKLAGVIGATLDPASLDDPDAFRRDVLRIVFPAAVSQALRAVGVRVGENATKQLIERYFTRVMVRQVSESASKWLGVSLTRKALATKAVPLVGAGIGAAWNWLELQAIGRRAIAYHTGENFTARVRRKVKSKIYNASSTPRRGRKLPSGD